MRQGVGRRQSVRWHSSPVQFRHAAARGAGKKNQGTPGVQWLVSRGSAAAVIISLAYNGWFHED